MTFIFFTAACLAGVAYACALGTGDPNRRRNSLAVCGGLIAAACAARLAVWLG